MKNTQLTKQEKKEIKMAGEQTFSGKCFIPRADIFESNKELYLKLDMAGVKKESININFEKNTLFIEGRIKTSEYEGLQPIYTEFNVGPYARKFEIPLEYNPDKITATMANGTLNITIPKKEEAVPRKIAIS